MLFVIGRFPDLNQTHAKFPNRGDKTRFPSGGIREIAPIFLSKKGRIRPIYGRYPPNYPNRVVTPTTTTTTITVKKGKFRPVELPFCAGRNAFFRPHSW